jgi:hypothetical protein
MRLPIALVLVAALHGAAFADCSSGCVAGGGPAATDCFVAWSGIPAMAFSCQDGDPTCDTDGMADGTCTFGVQACINVAGLPSCTPGTLSGPPSVKPAKDPAGQQLAAALASLDPAAAGCTTPGIAVPLKVSLAGIKPGKARLSITARSGGKRDGDKLRLTCLPSTTAPSFANQIQPIFTTKCAYAGGCHDSAFRGGATGQVLEPGVAYADTVNARAQEVPKFVRVKPGSIKNSFLARKILGQGLVPQPAAFGRMPLGCPNGSGPCVGSACPMGGCLSQAEILTLLYWIANGAPNN